MTKSDSPFFQGCGTCRWRANHFNLFHTHWEFPVLSRLQVELPALLDASEALRTVPWSQSFEVVSVQYCLFFAGVQLGATFDAPKVSDTHTLAAHHFFEGCPAFSCRTSRFQTLWQWIVLCIASCWKAKPLQTQWQTLAVLFFQGCAGCRWRVCRFLDSVANV